MWSWVSRRKPAATSSNTLMAWQNPPCGDFPLRDPILSKILLAKLAQIVVCFQLRGGAPCPIRRFSQD
jgi:hypothetical protein